MVALSHARGARRKEGRKLEPSLEASRETIYGHWKQCAAGRQRVPLPFFSPFATAAKLANPVCPTTLFFPPFPPLVSSSPTTIRTLSMERF